MISRALAFSWRRCVEWTPANGDRFFIPRQEIADSVFLVSDMVVELVTQKGESRFHFNGTVEWALDSVESSGVVWLPREDQLRDLLGEHFLSLDSVAGRYVVTVSGPGPGLPHRARRPTSATRTPGRCSMCSAPTAPISRPRRSRRRDRPPASSQGAYGYGPRAPAKHPDKTPDGAGDAAEQQGPEQQRPGVRCGRRADQGCEPHVSEAEAAPRGQPHDQIEQQGEGGASRGT